ncbi:glutamate receptor ionotropic, delta-1 [Periplaneta americana]|uniref:glutamate receptor ionotropic, delta-1 n=1 Tax=Periplaneta americana TaxID=6978 RepID=UPI0037E966D0
MAVGPGLVATLVMNLCTNYEAIMNGTTPDGEHIPCNIRIPKLLADKHITIAALDDYPLSYMEGSVGKGIVFDFVDILKEKYGFNYTVKMATENIIGDENTGIISMVYKGEADMAAAFLPVFHDMDHLVNFSTSLDESNWVVMMKRPSESATGSGLLAPFDSTVWVLILVSLIAIGPTIYIIILIRAKLCKGDEVLTAMVPLDNCIWFVYGALMKQGSTLMPMADSTRLLFATWWIFITILTSFYTANLTAFLTLSRFTLPIDGPRDLAKTKAGWIAHKGSSLEYLVMNDKDYDYLNRTIRDGKGRFLTMLDTEMLQLVKNKKLSLLRERRSVEYWMFRDYLTKAENNVPENERCTYVVTPKAFMVHGIAFAYPKNSDLGKYFDPLFQALVETGIVKHLLRKGLPPTEICPLNLRSTERQLRNGDLFTTYMVVVVGFASAIAAFVGEVFYTTVKRCSQGAEIELPDTDWTGNVGYKKSQMFPPPYSVLMQQQPGLGKHQNINGRDYLVINSKTGDPQLIPVRSPSAFLFQYSA